MRATKIEVYHGDITKVACDAVINAANKRLLGGGGVDGAIHRAGGKEILKECREIGGCPVGKAVLTTAGNLPAKYVIHTVGPVWHGGNYEEDKLLKNCYINSLTLALAYDIRVIAFPNISTGVYRFPKERAAKIAIKSVKEFIEENSGIEKIIFVCYNQRNYELYKKILYNEKDQVL